MVTRTRVGLDTPVFGDEGSAGSPSKNSALGASSSGTAYDVAGSGRERTSASMAFARTSHVPGWNAISSSGMSEPNRSTASSAFQSPRREAKDPLFYAIRQTSPEDVRACELRIQRQPCELCNQLVQLHRVAVIRQETEPRRQQSSRRELVDEPVSTPQVLEGPP